jgi:hypothetical protein
LRCGRKRKAGQQERDEKEAAYKPG